MLPVIAKCLVVNTEGEVPILRREPNDERRPGEPDLPGGGVEPGEDVTAAVMREIHEEAGLQARPEAVSIIYTATDEAKHRIRVWFLCKEYSGEVQLSHEHDAFWWKASKYALESLEGVSWAVGLRYAISRKLL